MRLLKIGALNAVSVGVRVLTSLAINKLLALLVGPAGYAVVGQFQNVVTLASTAASGLTGQGVTRFTAHYAHDPARRRALWGTAGTLTLIGCAVIAVPMIAASGVLAGWLLHDRRLALVFVLLALGLGALGINGLLLSILSGAKELRAFVIANIAGSLLGLALTAALALSRGLEGALIALALNQSLALGATALAMRGRDWFRWRDLIGPIDPVMARALGRHALMGAVALLATPIAQTLIRQALGARLGWSAAGVWDGMNRVSAMATMIFASSFSLWWLPRIAELRAEAPLRAEVGRVLALVVPVAAATGGALWLARALVVRLIFDPRFLTMTPMFGWQMAGDVLRVSGWVFGYVMVGRGLTRVYVASEIGVAALLVLLTEAFGRVYGLEGAAMGYALTYALDLVLVRAIYARAVRQPVLAA